MVLSILSLLITIAYRRVRTNSFSGDAWTVPVAGAVLFGMVACLFKTSTGSPMRPLQNDPAACLSSPLLRLAHAHAAAEDLGQDTIRSEPDPVLNGEWSVLNSTDSDSDTSEARVVEPDFDGSRAVTRVHVEWIMGPDLAGDCHACGWPMKVGDCQKRKKTEPKGKSVPKKRAGK